MLDERKKRRDSQKIYNFVFANNKKIKKEPQMKDTKNFEWLLNQPKQYQISLFGEYAEMMKILANQLMNEEIENKCGKRYDRSEQYSRWSSNPGSIKLGEEKILIKVPRYCDKQNDTKRNVEAYREIKEQEAPKGALMCNILLKRLRESNKNAE